MASPISSKRPLALLLIALALWGGWFIYRSSFVSDERRYFCLFDDAMISMTYARNLVEGHGLNWARQGEPVEGFTHPLWLVLMIPANALPVPLPWRSVLIQGLSLILLGATVVAVRRLVLAHFCMPRTCHWIPAAVLTAFYYPLDYWALMGMETALQALLTTWAVHFALDAVFDGRDRHLPLWLVCTAAYLLRMDMLLLVGAVQLFVLIRGGVRRAGIRSWLLGLAVFGIAVLGSSLFRWIYFHDVLPNTYYLKLAGIPLSVRLLRGWAVLVDFLRLHAPVLLPVGLGVGLLWRRIPRLVLPAAVFGLYCAYNVYVGGDAWDLGGLEVRANRFLAFVMPQAFVLLNALLNTLLDRTLGLWRSHRSPAEEREQKALAERYAAALVTAVSLLVLDGLWLSPQAAESWKQLAVITRPPHVDGARVVLDQLHRMQRKVAPGASVASTWAGIPAYFSDYRMVDVLGYNDRRIARMKSPVSFTDQDFGLFRPGHMKWNNRLLLEEVRPDAFLQLWGMYRPGRQMRKYGYYKVEDFWVRKGSPYVRGDGAPEKGRRSRDRRPRDRIRPVRQ